MMTMSDHVEIAAVKVFARHQCTEYPFFQRIMLQEPDHMSAYEFVIKCRTWLLLLAEERARRDLHQAHLSHDRLLIRE